MCLCESHVNISLHRRLGELKKKFLFLNSTAYLILGIKNIIKILKKLGFV